METIFEITDDTGLLGVFDPDAYRSFLGEDWSYGEILSHVREAMKERTLLLWATGREEIWRVGLRVGERRPLSGARAIDGGIVSTRGRLCFLNWEALTMAATYDTERLPDQSIAHSLFHVEPGAHAVSIVQRLSPESEQREETDFDLQVVRSDSLPPAWDHIPWHTS